MGKKIISLPSCESTNSLMIAMSQANSLEEGSIIITENQTSGRGQAGNAWLTEAGANLTFSVLLKPFSLEPANQFYLNMAVGLAVRNTVAELVLNQVKLKWPNDIMVDGKKVCGILIESQIQGQKFIQAVVGIGLNVNQNKFEWPQASSLCLCAGRFFNKEEVFEKLLLNLEAMYRLLQANDFTSLKREYHSVLYWRDEEHQFLKGEEKFRGIILGIDDVGRLQMKVGNTVRQFNFKEIKFGAS